MRSVQHRDQIGISCLGITRNLDDFFKTYSGKNVQSWLSFARLHHPVSATN